MAQVSEIDTAERVVHYLGEGPGTLRYDQLVLACGTNANLDVVKGMAQVALPSRRLATLSFCATGSLRAWSRQSYNRTRSIGAG